MRSWTISSNPMTPTVPSPTRLGKLLRKRFARFGFISGNYGRAMGQQQSIMFRSVLAQWFASRSRKR